MVLHHFLFYQIFKLEVQILVKEINLHDHQRLYCCHRSTSATDITMVAFFLVCSIFINLSKPCIACDLNLINYLFFCSKLTLTALFAQFLINSVHCTGNKIAKVSRDDVVNSFQYGIHSSIAFIALHSLQHCIHSTIAFIALHSFLCINVGCTPLTRSIQFRCSIERKWRQK